MQVNVLQGKWSGLIFYIHVEVITLQTEVILINQI